MERAFLQKIRGFYVASAIILANILVLLIFLNVFLGIAFFVKDRFTSKKASPDPGPAAVLGPGGLFYSNGRPFDNGNRSPYQLHRFDYTAYENVVDEEYVAAVLDDFFAISELGFMYQPWTQFSEPLYEGTKVHVDVDSTGIPLRRTHNPEPRHSSAVRIYVFGGSTTFGYNVSDEHTWPSHLSQILNERARAAGLLFDVDVANYGRGAYSTSQEMILLIDLFKSGHRPGLAVFLDGVNWGPEEDVPFFTTRFEERFRDAQFSSHDRRLHALRSIPMMRFLAGIRKRFSVPSVPDESKSDEELEEWASYAAKRVRVNRQIIEEISGIYGTETLFFLQPDALYDYPLDLFRNTPTERFFQEKSVRPVFYRELKAAEGAIDLTGLFAEWGVGRKAIIDDVHYSPLFNRFLAERIASHIDLGSLTPSASPEVDASESTGAPRAPRATGH